MTNSVSWAQLFTLAVAAISVSFAVLISVFILRERASVWRIGSALLILAGVALMRAG